MSVSTFNNPDMPRMAMESVNAESKTNTVPMDPAERLPDVAECTVHLELLDAFAHLKESVDRRGREEGLVGTEAWDMFCRAAAVKFLDWSQSVDAGADDNNGGLTLPTPSLDVLLVWHAFMLNPCSYQRYVNDVLGGRLGGKGINWDDVKSKLETEFKNTDAGLDTIVRASPKDKPEHTTTITTPDGFDMVAAVNRQLVFTTLMHHHGWLDYPSRDDLLTAAIARYERFFTLLAENPDVGVAPTQDIDLAWHTHQLSPRRYAAWCTARVFKPQAETNTTTNNNKQTKHRYARRIVDHCDDLPGEVLAQSADDAARLYEARFGDVYRMCLCRACAAARFGEALEEDSEGSVLGCASAGGAEHDPSASCSKNCEPVKCNTPAPAPQCKANCGAKCGYVCGACTAK